MVETQKQAMEEAKQLEDENRKQIAKLRDERNKLENQVENAEESSHTLQSVQVPKIIIFPHFQTENVKLRRELSQKKKLEEELHEISSENKQLRDLVQDKEKMAESIQFLIEENKRYRKEHEEMVFQVFVLILK
jgi:predicted RNase H-like nuclease (RuvC/YqgF family)